MNLWERQPSDTEESWEAFKSFRDAKPPRKLFRPGVPTGKTSEMYRDHNWKARVEAFDIYMDQKAVEERRQIVGMKAKEIAEEHMIILTRARKIVSRELDKLLEASNSDDMAGTIKPSELTKLLEAVIKFDRLVRGESTEKTDTGVDLSKLSLDELREFEKMQRKIGPA